VPYGELEADAIWRRALNVNECRSAFQQHIPPELGGKTYESFIVSGLMCRFFFFFTAVCILFSGNRAALELLS
jgi:hypothetical protein